MELLSVDTVSEARAKLMSLAKPLFTRCEAVATPHALGRIASVDIYSPENIPCFIRSTVDGYAVRASDTAGAGESIPSVLTLVGKVEMGADAAAFPGLSDGIAPGQCAYVPTGGMLPLGADAMIMIENTELFGANQVGIYSSVAVGTSVINPGDDVATGAPVCLAGCSLGAAEIGMFAALGILEVSVFAKPRVCIISTGDELVAPSDTPLAGQIRDINSWALAAQAELAGFTVSKLHVSVDDEAVLSELVEHSMQSADIVLVSGGSSQGEKDATARIIDKAASSGVITHGLALKPGKPTITGFDEPSATLLIGLPGHPLSAMMVFEVMLGWLKREAQGSAHPLPVPAVLARNLPSAAGKDTLQLVSLAAGTEEASLIATPVHTKSGLVSALARADGYLWINRNVEGLAAGSSVAVHLFKPL